MRRRCLLVLCFSLAACADGGLRRLSPGALRDLPAEGRRWIFDAENAVIVALDGVDVANEGVRDAAAHVARAERGLKTARAQQAKRGTGLGVAAAQSRLDWALLQQKLAEEKVRLARAKVYQARTALELDRARLVTAYDLVAERGFSMQPFEAQAQAAARQLEAQQKQVDALGKKLLEQAEKVYRTRQQYVAQTGDHDSGVWLD